MSVIRKSDSLSTDFKDGYYLCYPHSNEFCDSGSNLLLGRLDGMNASLWKSSLDFKVRSLICECVLSSERENVLWFDVAEKADRLVTVRDDEVWVYDLKNPGQGNCIYRAKPPAQLNGLPSVTSEGHDVVVGLQFPDRCAAVRIEVDSGRHCQLFERPWLAGHFHFSPYDETWIGFCHEGPCEQVDDRVWGWHATHAPDGRCLFDQSWGIPDRELFVGHERWGFHSLTALVVAYGVSPGQPRGTYELCPEGRPRRLISPGDRHLHVNASRSGRWAVVDTSGPHDIAGRGWESAEGVSDILLLDMATGEQHFLARSRIASHPSHPHPRFSPDDRFIFFNEAGFPGNRVVRVENPCFSPP